MISFKEMFPAEICFVQNKPYLFSNMRVDRDTVPNELYAYDVRDDCDGQFWEIQKFVMVNHWGTCIGKEPIELDERGQYWCEPEKGCENVSSEGWFSGGYVEDETEYLKKYEDLKLYGC